MRGTDLVSFVFGLEVNWNLTEAQNTIDADAAAENAEKKRVELDAARERLGKKVR